MQALAGSNWQDVAAQCSVLQGGEQAPGRQASSPLDPARHLTSRSSPLQSVHLSVTMNVALRTAQQQQWQRAPSGLTELCETAAVADGGRRPAVGALHTVLASLTLATTCREPGHLPSGSRQMESTHQTRTQVPQSRPFWNKASGRPAKGRAEQWVLVASSQSARQPQCVCDPCNAAERGPLTITQKQQAGACRGCCLWHPLPESPAALLGTTAASAAAAPTCEEGCKVV